MRWHRCAFLLRLSVALLVAWVVSPGQAEESGDLKAELEKLKTEFEQIKTSYEARIRALEEKVSTQEALKATIEAKQKEIQALNDKVVELKKRGDVEGLAGRVERLEEAEAPRHKAAPVGAYGGLMNPDISLVVDVKGLLSDTETNPLDEKIMLEHAELAIQSYLWPGIRGDFIGAIGQHPEDGGAIHTHTEIEEGHVSFLDLPANFQLQVGRKLLDFGRLNSIHPHHWAIPDTPLPLLRLFGDHSWYDDGFQVSTLIPNPWDVYLKVQGGVWNGRALGEAEDHEHEHAAVENNVLGFQGPVDWGGRVYTARASVDLPLSDDTNLMTGYSLAGGEGGESVVHGADLTLVHRWPQSYRRIRWQNEFFFGDFELAEEQELEHEHEHNRIGEYDADAWGLYSLLQLTLSKYWETGARYDRWDGDYLEAEWGATAFLSYYFTHSMYVRPSYRYSELADGEDEHAFMLQFVWGLGPHAHRLED
ncbi:MAG: hypothetical protein Q8Q12_15595 [bacterium]|nr:hypothetical protein [bacterium]